jgi:hypothetical protein
MYGCSGLQQFRVLGRDMGRNQHAGELKKQGMREPTTVEDHVGKEEGEVPLLLFQDIEGLGRKICMMLDQ